MNELKFKRISWRLSQEKLSHLTKRKVPRWRISLAEAGELNLNDSELGVLAKVLRTNPRTLLSPAAQPVKARNENPKQHGGSDV